MKSWYAILGLCAWLGFSCSDELDRLFIGESGETSYLNVSVSNRSFVKAKVEGGYLPEGAELGVFLRAVDGCKYEGLGDNNVRYTANGAGAEQTWAADENHPIGLTKSLGTAYAYYPWQHREVTELRVPISNDGTDWMYGEPVTNLSTENNVARFEMSHAMCIVRCKIVKGDFVGAGVVTTAGVASEGLAQSAVLDLSIPEVTSFEKVNTDITIHDVGTLSEVPLVVELWGVPTGTAATLNFKMVADGSVYRASVSDLTLEGGYVYQYSITVNSKSLAVSGVSVQEWGSDSGGSYASGITMPWSVARENDGVYAIDEFGQPIPYAKATADQYAGVAFVVRGKAYQVAKVDAYGSDGSKNVYWWKNNYEDIPELLNWSSANGSVRSGYFGVQLGSEDSKTWLKGALSDFNGRGNTELIIAGQTKEGVILDDTVAKTVVDFRQNTSVNGGYNDWFVPSEGELVYMMVSRDYIIDLLSKIPDSETLWANNTVYVSSSVSVNATIWGVAFSHINTFYKNEPYSCRLIREIK